MKAKKGQREAKRPVNREDGPPGGREKAVSKNRDRRGVAAREDSRGKGSLTAHLFLLTQIKLNCRSVLRLKNIP